MGEQWAGKRLVSAAGAEQSTQQACCRREEGGAKEAQSTHRSSSLGVGSSMGTATPKPALGRLAMGADMRRTGT